MAWTTERQMRYPVLLQQDEDGAWVAIRPGEVAAGPAQRRAAAGADWIVTERETAFIRPEVSVAWTLTA